MIRRRKVVMWFSKLMEQTLQDNDYKGGWENCSYTFLVSKLNEEVDELKKQVWKDCSSPTAMTKLIKEATDVANIAMMIADITREE